MNEQPQDCMKQFLSVGDLILFTRYNEEDFYDGKILSMTEKTIICEGKNTRFTGTNPNYNYVKQARIKTGHSSWRILKK